MAHEPVNVLALQEVQALLRLARNRIKRVGAPRTTNKIRASLKSIDGAIRHARCRASRRSNA